MEGVQNTNEQLGVFKRYLPLLSAVPYSRAFPLVGSLARGSANAESDIDLVVIAREDRVWINRVLLLLTVALLGQRRTAKKRRGRFCFNASCAPGEGAEDILKFYPSFKLVRGGSRAGRAARTVFEFILELSLLGAVLDRLSQKLLTGYINSRFARFKNNQETILILRRNLIVYHPPRHFCG